MIRAYANLIKKVSSPLRLKLFLCEINDSMSFFLKYIQVLKKYFYS